MLRPDGFVALDLLVDGVPVTGVVHRSRSSGAPGAPSQDLEAAALLFTATYVEEHPFLFHRLFAGAAPPRGFVSSAWAERHGSDVRLGFKLVADGTPLEMLITSQLDYHPRRTPKMDEDVLLTLWASAYDVCLSYMVEHLDEIKALGFDTSELVRQSLEVGGNDLGMKKPRRPPPRRRWTACRPRARTDSRRLSIGANEDSEERPARGA